MVGVATSTFPTTVGRDLTYNGFIEDGFIVKVKPDGTGLAYAGFIGSDSAEKDHGVAVDEAGAAYVTGGIGTTSTFPTQGGFDTSHNGKADVFVVKVAPDGTGFEWGTFLGGPEEERGSGIAVDPDGGDVYVTGYTNSARIQRPGRPVGPDLTFNSSHTGPGPKDLATDALVAKISEGG